MCMAAPPPPVVQPPPPPAPVAPAPYVPPAAAAASTTPQSTPFDASAPKKQPNRNPLRTDSGATDSVATGLNIPS
jgi:hypothetical protein